MLPSNAGDWDDKNSPAPRRRAPRPGGGLLVTLVLLVALIAVIALGVSHLPTGTPPRPAAVATTQPPAGQPAVSAAAGTPADAATQRAIQDVIQKLDNAQAQAIATGDEQVMSATATPDFYQLQVATNQDLVANGVTEVKLLNLEWGDITVNGNSASATVYETWSTTYDDGTTEQARDRNVYSLIKDQTKGWIVQADDHPDQPTGPSAPAAPGAPTQ